MKYIKNLICLMIMILSINLSQAQEKETVYYYVFASAYINGEGKKAIVSDVRSVKCEKRHSSSISDAMKLQFNSHLKANYQNYFSYSIHPREFESRAEAEEARLKFIADYKNDDYSVTKDIDFTFYCN